MRVSCPACHAEYEVPDSALTGRPRTLRCGQCGNQWQISPLAAATAGAALGADLASTQPPPAPWPPAPPPASFPPPQPEAAMAGPNTELAAADPGGMEIANHFDPKSTAKLTYGTAGYEIPRDVPVTPQAETRSSRWLVSILILLIAALMVWIERVHIMHIWPPSTRLFNAITALAQQFLPHNANLPKD